MEVTLTAEQESRLTELAERDGKTPDEIARDAIDRYIGEDAEFIAAVAKGLAALDRGEFIAHEEVRKRIDRLLAD
jgi:predicted transcriptional regulator